MTHLEKAEILLKLALNALKQAEDDNHSAHIEDAIGEIQDGALVSVRMAKDEIEEQADEKNAADYFRHMRFECRQERFV